jgi:aminocarboxymuconate-semialdehyde decarboxylase
MKIDIHAHFIPRECFGMLDDEGRPFGPSIGRDGTGQEVIFADGVSLGPLVAPVTDPVVRIRDMDRMGIDMQAISINPSSVFNAMKPGAASPLYRRYNDAIAQVVTAHPDRFVGFATVPLQDVDAAVVELERAVRIGGLRGVQVGSNINGKNLDEREFWPFYQKAEELEVPIFMHPYYVAAPERMQRYWLINLIGNPIDTAIAVGSLIFGGVLESFPRLKFVIAHGGGAAPYIEGRWSHGYREVDQCRSVPRPPSSYIKQMYFDTLTHSDLARTYLVGLVGADHVVLGSDYPFQMGDLDPVGTVRDSVGLSARDKETILERSAGALLGHGP